VQDAALFASWEVDLLKYDNCFTDGSKPEVRAVFLLAVAV
jgi:alpha-galactosidase